MAVPCQTSVPPHQPRCAGALRQPYGRAMAIQIRTSVAEPETGETFTPHRPARPDKAESGRKFVLQSDYTPAGDQPTAIKELVEGIADNGEVNQVLLGV